MAKKKLDLAKIAAKGWATRRAKVIERATKAVAERSKVVADMRAQRGQAHVNAAPTSEEIYFKSLLDVLRGTNDDVAIATLKQHLKTATISECHLVRRTQQQEFDRELIKDFMCDLDAIDRIVGTSNAPIMIGYTTAKAVKNFIYRHYNEIYNPGLPAPAGEAQRAGNSSSS